MTSKRTMFWNMNCRRTRRFLALWAGSDLEQRECQVAERHLAVCPACREVWESLKQSQYVLEQARSASLEVEGQVSRHAVSLWTGVDRQLRSMRYTVEEAAAVPTWRDWLPAGAVAAACLAIISVTITDVPKGESSSPEVIMSSPAAFDFNPRHFGPSPLGLHHADQHRQIERVAPVAVDEQPRF